MNNKADPLKICTLLLLVRDGRILLAMKKRGFGSGRYNGVGGKITSGETIEQALVRECQEEIEVTPTKFDKVALHDFAFPDGTPDMQVHAYICTEWEGEPVETEEMAPKWFDIADIPYDKMWQDDIIWLPLVLVGKKMICRFVFDENDIMLSGEFKFVDKLR